MGDAYTPRGTFKIQRQIKGIRKAALGTIYYPSYFNGGIAIHGSNSIPEAASHGCARIPRFADKQFADMVKVGMTSLRLRLISPSQADERPTEFIRGPFVSDNDSDHSD